MYCGDETGSFIGDVGSHTCRFGYGGEDNPKYVVPSYMAAVENDMDGDTTQNSKAKKKYIPSSCYQGRLASQEIQPILRMPSLWKEDDHSKLTTEQQLASATAPHVDPTAYLQQGDSIQNWDALEHVWQSSFEVLRVSDTRKHTLGGTPYTKQKQPAQAQERVSSSTIRPSAESSGSGKCVHPILAVTPGLTYRMGNVGLKHAAALQRDQHVRYTEFLMETMEAPAVFLAPTPMLSSFSVGRQTSLVVDVGAGGCRVTPLVDGLPLHHAQRRNGRGGDWLGNVSWRALLDDKVVLRPRYQLRQAVSALQTKSPYLYRWAMQDLMFEVRTSSSHVTLTEWCQDERMPFLKSNKKTESAASSEEEDDNDDINDDDEEKEMSDQNSKQDSNEEETDDNDDADGDGDNDAMDVDDNKETSEAVATLAGSTYELPDGTCIDLTSPTGKDLCRLPELLFTDDVPFVTNPSKGLLAEHHTLSNLPLHRLIYDSLSAVGDGDIRKELANNIVLTGGGSVIPNLEQRLSLELPRIVPSAYKCRVIASRNSIERSCAAWIGASILTSLGSFQQLWLSRTEYEEYGTTLAIQRFP